MWLASAPTRCFAKCGSMRYCHRRWRARTLLLAYEADEIAGKYFKARNGNVLAACLHRPVNGFHRADGRLGICATPKTALASNSKLSHRRHADDIAARLTHAATKRRQALPAILEIFVDISASISVSGDDKVEEIEAMLSAGDESAS